METSNGTVNKRGQCMDALREAFQYLDKNGDGRVSVREITSFIRGIGQPCSYEGVRALIQKLTRTGEDYIDFKDFMEILSEPSTSQNDYYQIFNVFDKNGDGYICADELNEIMKSLGENLTQEDIEDMINEADYDGDKKVNFKEFLRIVKS
ncbi:hypothetical protein GJ496_005129 [Pomphorhynchus laevis]|nr:hypothetical protein GJ496_005129 [Pomphorhynchus laevis]